MDGSLAAQELDPEIGTDQADFRIARCYWLPPRRGGAQQPLGQKRPSCGAREQPAPPTSCWTLRLSLSSRHRHTPPCSASGTELSLRATNAPAICERIPTDRCGSSREMQEMRPDRQPCHRAMEDWGRAPAS